MFDVECLALTLQETDTRKDKTHVIKACHLKVYYNTMPQIYNVQYPRQNHNNHHSRKHINENVELENL